MCFTKLYVGKRNNIHVNDSEWTTAPTAWEALTKLELIEFEVVEIQEDFKCTIGSNVICALDIMMWLLERTDTGNHVPPNVDIVEVSHSIIDPKIKKIA